MAAEHSCIIPPPQWVISDTHFRHENILEYCPWRKTWASTVEDQDRAMIAAWQQTVQPEDWVLHLGDFALGSKDDIALIRRQLPGRIILVRGNHDRSTQVMITAGFDLVCSHLRIEAEGQRWIGRHNPAAFTVREASSAVRLLHGHAHGNGYSSEVPPAVVARSTDCSLDALRSIAPVPWSRLSGAK